MRSTITRTVPVPIDTVWAVLTDHEGMSDWGPGISAKVTKSGTAERNGAGAVREVSSALPLPTIVEEIVEFDAPRHFAYRALAGVPLRDYRGDVELESTGSGTTIRYSISGNTRVAALAGIATRAVAFTLATALVRAVRRRAA